MTELDVLGVLKEMKIHESYLSISERYTIHRDDLFRTAEPQNVLGILDTLGVVTKYNKRERYITVHFPDYLDAKFSFNLDTRGGMVDVIWNFSYFDKVVFSKPMSLLAKQLSDEKIETTRPLYSSYVDLEGILDQIIDLYEEFREKIILMIDEKL